MIEVYPLWWLIVLPCLSIADGHQSKSNANPPFSMQNNVCSLEAGKNMANYEKVFGAAMSKVFGKALNTHRLS